MVWPSAANSWCTSPRMSKNTMSMLLVALRLCLAFFGLGDPGLFHCEDYCLVSGSYPQTQLSSPVMNLDIKDGSSRARCFCSGVRSLGTNFAATRCMFKSHVRIVCTLPYDTLTIAAMSLMVLRRPSCTSRRIVSAFYVLSSWKVALASRRLRAMFCLS